jgi:hypothetical protein
MVILFVGGVSAANVWFYAQYGYSFPYGAEAHATLFGVSTMGAILIMMVMMDLFAADYIEEFLLRRAIDGYWARKQREEDNKRRVRESLRQFQQSYNIQPYGDTNLPTIKNEPEPETLSPKFLTIDQ